MGTDASTPLICVHLLGKGRPLGFLVCCISYVFVTFPYDVPDQALYLIVPISDICLPMCFSKNLFQEHFQSVKRIGSRSGVTDLGPKLLVKVVIAREN